MEGEKMFWNLAGLAGGLYVLDKVVNRKPKRKKRKATKKGRK